MILFLINELISRLFIPQRLHMLLSMPARQKVHYKDKHLRLHHILGLLIGGKQTKYGIRMLRDHNAFKK